MVISQDKWKLITKILNTVNTENVEFFSDDGILGICYNDKSGFLRLKTDVKWDLDINSFVLVKSNLDVFSSDVEITYDDFIYIKSDSSTLRYRILEDLFFNKQDLLKQSDTVQVIEINEVSNFYDILLKLSNTYNPSSEDFSSCIYMDSECYFSSNRIISSFIEVNTGITGSIITELTILPILRKFKDDDLEQFKFIFNNHFNSICFDIDGISVFFGGFNSNFNYPDFKKIFRSFEYTDLIGLRKSDLKEVIDNILKFDSKINKIKFIVESDEITVSGISLLNGSNFKFELPHLNGGGLTNYSFIVSPQMINKCIMDLPDIISLRYNATKIVPLQISADDLDLELSRFVLVFTE